MAITTQFKGIKQVLKATYSKTSTNDREGYIWFVRDVDSTGSSATVKSADIFLGSKHYAHIGANDIDAVEARLKTLEGTVGTNSTNIKKIQDWLGELVNSYTNLTGLVDELSAETAKKVASVSGKEAIAVTTGTTPEVSLKIVATGNNVTLSQDTNGLKAAAVTSEITSGATGLAVAGKVYDAIEAEKTRATDAESANASAIEELKELVGETSVDDAIEAAIAELDSTVSGEGAIVTAVTQTDGKVSVTKGNLTSTGQTLVVNGLDLAVNIDGTTIVKGTDGKLGVASSALTQYGGKDAVKVSDVNTQNTKTISLAIATANKVLTQSADGLDTTLGLKFVKASENTAEGTNQGKAVVQLTGVSGAVLGEFDASDLVMDGVLDKVELKNGVLTFTWSTAAGKEPTTINLADYIKPYTNGNGLNLTDQTFSVKIKDNDKYLTVDESGVASKGIDEAITAAVEALDAEKEGKGAGEFVTVKVTEVDGKITEVAVTEKDIASATALNTEIAARKAIDGQSGQTYAANAGTTYISGATSLNDADTKLDAAIKAVADTAISVTAGDGITVGGTGAAKTISAKIKKDDTYLTVDGDGIASKGIDSAISTAVAAVEAQIGGDYSSTDTVDAAIKALDVAVLKEIEKGTDGTYVTTTVSEKASNKQSISVSVTTKAVASATTSDNGLAVAADVKSYVDGAVSAKNVSAEGDDYVSAVANANKVTVAATKKTTDSLTKADTALQTVTGGDFISVTAKSQNSQVVSLDTEGLIAELMKTFISGDDDIDAGTWPLEA